MMPLKILGRDLKNDKNSLRILYLNLQDLGGGPGRGRRSDDAINRLAERFSHYDVILLLEIKVRENNPSVNPIDKIDKMLNEALGGILYKVETCINETEGNHERTQAIAVFLKNLNEKICENRDACKEEKIYSIKKTYISLYSKIGKILNELRKIDLDNDEEISDITGKDKKVFKGKGSDKQITATRKSARTNMPTSYCVKSKKESDKFNKKAKELYEKYRKALLSIFAYLESEITKSNNIIDELKKAAITSNFKLCEKKCDDLASYCEIKGFNLREWYSGVSKPNESKRDKEFTGFGEFIGQKERYTNNSLQRSVSFSDYSGKKFSLVKDVKTVDGKKYYELDYDGHEKYVTGGPVAYKNKYAFNNTPGGAELSRIFRKMHYHFSESYHIELSDSLNGEELVAVIYNKDKIEKSPKNLMKILEAQNFMGARPPVQFNYIWKKKFKVNVTFICSHAPYTDKEKTEKRLKYLQDFNREVDSIVNKADEDQVVIVAADTNIQDENQLNAINKIRTSILKNHGDKYPHDKPTNYGNTSYIYDYLGVVHKGSQTKINTIETKLKESNMVKGTKGISYTTENYYSDHKGMCLVLQADD